MFGFGNFVHFLCVAVVFIQKIHGLYEDQAGLFDWRQQYIGKAKFIEYMTAGHSSARIIVGTEQNVITAINAHNGHIGWRHILERGINGRVDDMKVSSNYVVTVIAGGSYIRCFNVVSGSLLWESSVLSAVPSHRASIQFIGFELRRMPDVLMLTLKHPSLLIQMCDLYDRLFVSTMTLWSDLIICD